MAFKYAQVMASDIVLYKDDMENDKFQHQNNSNLGAVTDAKILMASEKIKTKINDNLKTESLTEFEFKKQNPAAFNLKTEQNYFLPKKIHAQTNVNIKIVGIDLGTSRCCAAINRNDEIITIPLDSQGKRDFIKMDVLEDFVRNF
uniref:Heat shock protein 70 n=1 Tax=Panagrolaimus sp. ES5 TaxID=591445 RepID=A0AC34GJ67_9BILA